MNFWLIVHDMQAFEEGKKADGSNTIGFQETAYNAKHIKPNDIVIYYLKSEIALKGIYQVKPKPWSKVRKWDSDYQIGISPIIELEEACDFKEIIPKLDLFKGMERWYLKIQGTNSIRKISKNDFLKIKGFLWESRSINKKRDFPALETVSRNREYNGVSRQLRTK